MSDHYDYIRAKDWENYSKHVRPDYEPLPPSKATNYRQGTKDKVEVMAKRLQDGEEIWHPSDPAGRKR